MMYSHLLLCLLSLLYLCFGSSSGLRCLFGGRGFRASLENSFQITTFLTTPHLLGGCLLLCLFGLLLRLRCLLGLGTCLLLQMNLVSESEVLEALRSETTVHLLSLFRVISLLLRGLLSLALL